MSMVSLDPPVRLSQRSEALLASLVGQVTKFNVPAGRIFLDRSIDAQGVIIESFPDHRKRPWKQRFYYFTGLVGREHQRRSSGIRQPVILPRLPVGLFRLLYRWRPRLGHYSRQAGFQIINPKGLLRKTSKIEVFSELVSFEIDDDQLVYVEADRRICFTLDNDESIAFEFYDSGNPPLGVMQGDRRPEERSFSTLKSRLVFRANDVANSASTGH